jgi:hypothetical protein
MSFLVLTGINGAIRLRTLPLVEQNFAPMDARIDRTPARWARSSILPSPYRRAAEGELIP